MKFMKYVLVCGIEVNSSPNLVHPTPCLGYRSSFTLLESSFDITKRLHVEECQSQ